MKTYVGEKETTWLFVMLFISRFLLRGINSFVASTGNTAYISIFLCAAAVLLIFWLTNKIIPLIKYNLSELVNKVYGRKIGLVLGSVIFVITVLNASSRLRMFTAAVGDEVMTASPIMYIMLFFGAGAAAAAYFGAEPLTRYSYIAGILMFAASAVVCALNIKHINIENLLPHKGVYSGSIGGIFSHLYMFSDALYLYCMPRFLKSGKSVNKIGTRALAISGTAVTLIAFFYCAAVPYPSSAEFEYPFFRLSALAEASLLLQRMEGFVYLIWIFSGFISVGALAMFAMNIFFEVFDTSDAKGTLPLLIFIIIGAAYSKSDFEKALNYMICITAFIFTPITAVLYRIRSRRTKA